MRRLINDPELLGITREAVEGLPDEMAYGDLSVLLMCVAAMYIEKDDVPAFFTKVSRMAKAANKAAHGGTRH